MIDSTDLALPSVGQIRAQAPAFSFHHVALGAIGRAIKERLPIRGIAGQRRRFHFNASQIRNHLPDLLVLHLDANASERGRHVRSWNSIVDGPEEVGVGVAMLLLCMGQIGASPSAVSAQPVAQRAIDAEMRLARLSGLGIVRKRVAILRAKGCGQREQNQSTHREQSRGPWSSTGKPTWWR